MLLEGSDIRALLQQVRDDHGPEARIVHAERVRAGGIGGFFAKQRYEVTVELDGVSGVELDSAALLASFDDAGTADEAPAGPQPLAARAPVPGRNGDRIEPLDAVPTVDPARRIASVTRAENAGTTQAWTPAALPSQRAGSTEPSPAPTRAPGVPAGSAVDLVLDALDQADAARSLRPVGPGASAAVAGAPSLVPHALTAPFTPVPAGDTAVAAPAAPADEPTPLFDLSAWVETRESALAEASAARTPAEPAPGTDARDVPALATTASMAALAALATAASSVQTSTPSVQPTVPDPIATVTPLHVVEPVAVPATEADVPTVPRRPGDLLVLLGDAVPAYATARTLCAGMRVPGDDVVVVAHEPVVPGLPEDRRLGDALEARLHGAQLALARTAGIVVVDAPAALMADPLGQEWVAQIVAALGATAMWAVVDATRRTEDLEAWLAVLPPVTGLAAHSVAATSRPEAIHPLSVPVAVVDGRPAGAPAVDSLPGIPDTLRRTS
jgi:hypothetical protein